MLLPISIIALFAIIALGIESLNPIEAQSSKSAPVNSITGVCQMLFVQLVAPVLGPAVIWIAGKLGPAPIHLSGKVWMLPGSVLTLLAFTDLIDYSFHRLQHRLNWLWSMHSFHHSDRTVNATTGYRHFWLERPLLAIAYIPIGLVFRADSAVIIISSLVGWTLPLFVHLNMKIGFGKWSWAFVSPQFHRIHHSIDKEHHDKNFAGLLPLWDVLFGSYCCPRSDEYPSTGLEEDEPMNLFTALLWPFRRKDSSNTQSYLASATPYPPPKA